MKQIPMYHDFSTMVYLSKRKIFKLVAFPEKEQSAPLLN